MFMKLIAVRVGGMPQPVEGSDWTGHAQLCTIKISPLNYDKELSEWRVEDRVNASSSA